MRVFMTDVLVHSVEQEQLVTATYTRHLVQ
jgi:hypothetical protein